MARWLSETVLEPLSLRTKTRHLAQALVEVIQDVGPPLSVRQVYYQLASRGYVPLDHNRGYRPVQRLIDKLREAGSIPYNWIVDRTRQPIETSSWSGPQDCFETVREAYRKGLWQTQPHYVEIWLEKDALSAIFPAITSEFQVRLMVSRGFNSDSFLYEAAMELIQVKKPIYIYYFGDHDPCGRLIESQVKEGLEQHGVVLANFERVAILQEDIEEYSLPPNPAKKTDPRYRRFVQKYGKQAVELDALPLGILRSRITNCITRHLNMAEWRRLKVVEEQERLSIRRLLDGFPALQEVRP